MCRHAVRILADGLDHPESVTWDPVRRVLFCGGEEGQLYAVALDGTVRLAATTGGSLLGVAVHPSGLVHACDAGRRAVLAIDPDTGAVRELSTGVADRRLVEPNGIAVDADGTTYVTCSGHWGADDGAVYRIDTDGSTELWSTAAPCFPNGCAVHDGQLLVVESRDPRVVALELAGGGGRPRTVAALAGTVPDQLAVDDGGGLVVGCYRPDVLLHVDAGGHVRELVRDPSAMVLAAPTGCVFAGDEAALLVVANYGARSLVLVNTIPAMTSNLKV